VYKVFRAARRFVFSESRGGV